MFYPGFFWVKRLSHLFILCTIGINLFISDVQQTLLLAGQDMLHHAAMLADPAENVAHAVENNILPAISYIEESRFAWVIDHYHIPDTYTLETGIAHTYALKEALQRNAPIYTNLAVILNILSICFWVPIGFSGYWIVKDIQHSPARLFDIPVVLGAIYFNLASYTWLVTQFEITL